MRDSLRSPHSVRDPCKVTANDLSMLDRIHKLLSLLNDPYAGGQDVAKLVESIPVLEARCMRSAAGRFANRRIESTGYALTLIGNRGLETALLDLLEELTILKADMQLPK